MIVNMASMTGTTKMLKQARVNTRAQEKSVVLYTRIYPATLDNVPKPKPNMMGRITMCKICTCKSPAKEKQCRGARVWEFWRCRARED